MPGGSEGAHHRALAQSADGAGMKVLTATSTGQGDRPGDYCWTVEGELVVVLEPCARDRRDPDGGCGCGRGFAGMSSQRGTTTGLVREVEIDAQQYRDIVAAHVVALGFGPVSQDEDEVADFAQAMDDLAEDLLRWAAAWPVGSVLGRRLDSVHVRTRGQGAGDYDHLLRRRDEP